MREIYNAWNHDSPYLPPAGKSPQTPIQDKENELGEMPGAYSAWNHDSPYLPPAGKSPQTPIQDTENELGEMPGANPAESRLIIVMKELERQGTEDFVLLANDGLRNWWVKYKAIEAKKEAARSERIRLQKVREGALAKLTDEERKVLKIGKS